MQPHCSFIFRPELHKNICIWNLSQTPHESCKQFLRHISFRITNVHTSVFYALSNYNMATVHGGGILRFLFADSLSTRDAANHSSGHAGVELCNELLMGNRHSSQL